MIWCFRISKITFYSKHSKELKPKKSRMKLSKIIMREFIMKNDSKVKMRVKSMRKMPRLTSKRESS